MHRFNCVITAIVVIVCASPSFAEDTSKAGPTAKTERSSSPGGEVKRETTGGQMGGKIRSGDDRAGLQVETPKGERSGDRARAEQVVVVHRGHHHRHHHHEI